MKLSYSVLKTLYQNSREAGAELNLTPKANVQAVLNSADELKCYIFDLRYDVALMKHETDLLLVAHVANYKKSIEQLTQYSKEKFNL